MIGSDYGSSAPGYTGVYPTHGVYPIHVASDERLRDVGARFAFGGGGTDCSLPFTCAMGREFDAIAIFTDNETWHGGRTRHRP